MRKYIISVIAVAAALFAGCSKSDFQTVAPSSRTVKVSAALEGTRAALNGEKLVWEAGDVIGVWTGSAFTPFTVDAACAGQGAGTFTGTLPEGGAINESSYAVFPYREGDTMEGTVYKSDLTDRNTKYALAAKPTATASGSTTVADYKFGQLTAAVKVTVKNIPAEANFIFFESDKQLFVNNAEADLSAEFPKFNVTETGDWYFYALPEHTGAIESLDLVVPIVTGGFAGPKFRFTLFSAEDWGAEFPKDPYNHYGFLDTGGVINRSDVFVLPDVTF